MIGEEAEQDRYVFLYIYIYIDFDYNSDITARHYQLMNLNKHAFKWSNQNRQNIKVSRILHKDLSLVGAVIIGKMEMRTGEDTETVCDTSRK